ncbi:unnamed protein product [Linum trigynum]|uniref:Reverse transcriptase domain-containing protein n=1 Tax=Linum trigynum TaxID=586398 RepID=A0AAV2FW64_9ROSI
MVNSMRLKTGRKGQMVLKIDLAKAYDRLNWAFIRDTLLAVNFPPQMVQVIMECVTSASMQVLWNGSCTESFTPSRGLRQGCPLSPYIFTLCMERLGHLIQKEVEGGRWKPIQASPGGPALSHIFFADDLVLFAEASEEQGELIMKCLDQFFQASGQ